MVSLNCRFLNKSCQSAWPYMESLESVSLNNALERVLFKSAVGMTNKSFIARERVLSNRAVRIDIISLYQIFNADF